MKAHIFVMLLVLQPLWVGPLSAQAVSSFGCSALQLAGVAAVEGEGGTFFRVQSDLRLRQPIEPQVIAQIASLSQMLAAGGTTLIYVAVPTKAQAMPDLLPSVVEDLRYDTEIATLMYNDVLGEFARQGVLAPDLVAAFAGAGADEAPFFQSDFHWTSGGAALAATAIAEIIKAAPSYAQMQTAPYATSTGKNAAAFSTLRRGLQIFCTQDLPKVEGLVHTTTKVTTELAASDIFAGTTLPQIVLVGTSFSDAPLANFAGALSQNTGLDVLNYGITGGNQFGAITSYLISDDFAAQRPRFLIWENPIYNNLAQFGPDPMAELIAAASASCTQILDAKISGTHTLTADLTGVQLSPDDTIFANLGSSDARGATFELITQSGIARRSVMLRGSRVQSSGRFYKPLGTLWHSDFQSLSVTFDQPVTAGSQLALCHTEKDAL